MSYGKQRGKASHEIAKNPYSQTPQQPIPPPSGSEPGRTSYWSANNEDRSTFMADAPANSRHAARLMKIAMQNQPKYGKAEKTNQKRLDGKGQQQRRLTSQGEPVQQQPLGGITNKSSRSLATMSQEETNSQTYPPNSQSYPPNTQPYPPPSQSYPPPPSAYPYPPSSLLQQQPSSPTPPLPSIYRYETAGSVTYHQVAPSGSSLKISAPLGSQEAQEMEYAATRLCKPSRPTYHNDDGYVDDYDYEEEEDEEGQGREVVRRGGGMGGKGRRGR